MALIGAYRFTSILAKPDGGDKVDTSGGGEPEGFEVSIKALGAFIVLQLWEDASITGTPAPGEK